MFTSITENTHQRLQLHAQQRQCSVDELINHLLDQEAALRRTEERFKLAAQIARLGIWDWEIATDKTEWYGEMFRIYGITEAEFTGKGADYIEFTREDYRITQQANIKHAFEHGISEAEILAHKEIPVAPKELCIVQPDGTECYTLGDAIAIVDEAGQPVRMLGVTFDITERKQAEMVLRHNKERLKMILQGTLAGTWEWNVQTGETVFNERWAEIVGYTLSELSPITIQTWINLTHPEDLQVSNALLEKHFADPAIYYQCEVRMKHKAGHWVWVWDRGKVLEWTSDGKPLRMFGTHLDITERKNAEEAVRRHEAQFKGVIDGSPVPFALNDNAQNITYLNPAFMKTFGYTLEDIPTLKEWWELAYPDPDYRQWSANIWWEHLERARQTGKPFEPVEVKICCKDGSYRTVLVDAAALSDTLEGVHLVILYDITERQQAEQALKISEEKFSTIFHAAPLIITLTTVLEGKLLDANAEFYKVLGFTPEEVIGKTSLEAGWVMADTRTTWIARLIEQRQLSGVEIEFFTKDHQKLTCLYSGVLLQMGDQQYILSAILDITERKQMEQEIRWLNESLEQRVIERTAALQAANEQSEIVLRNVTDGILLTDPEGNILYANPAWEALTGYTLSETIQANPRILQSGMTPLETYHQMWATILVGQTWHGILKNKHKSGSVYDAELIIAPVRDQVGQIQHFVGVQRDITEMVKLERMKEQFIADAAHDLKNPITSLNLILYKIRKSPERLNAHLAQLEMHIQRLSTLISDLLTLARLDRKAEELIHQAVNLNEIVARLLQQNLPLAEHKLQALSFEATAPLPLIQADALHVERIITNLLANALNYTPEQGQIRLATYQSEAWVVLSVQDSGIGISPDDLPHIFERFFRTSQARKTATGTGLGLPIVKELVELHRGKLEVESTLAVGTTFRVYLPITPSLRDND